MIIDAHAHLWNTQAGRVNGKPVIPLTADNQQIVHNQQIGEQHFEGAQAQETAVDQKPHHRKRQLQIAEIQPVGQAVGGNRHFAQHIDRHQRQSQPAGTPLEVPKQDKRNDVAGQGGTENIK